MNCLNVEIFEDIEEYDLYIVIYNDIKDKLKKIMYHMQDDYSLIFVYCSDKTLEGITGQTLIPTSYPHIIDYDKAYFGVKIVGERRILEIINVLNTSTIKEVEFVKSILEQELFKFE